MQIDLHKPILDKNDRLADENRELFREKKVFVLDLLASPGSGKTSTILATIEALRDHRRRHRFFSRFREDQESGNRCGADQYRWRMPFGKCDDPSRGGCARSG